jgi:GINS complex subunit 2
VFSASDDIVEPELTRRLLRDLREVRQAKARKGIDTIVDTHLQMDNLGVMEINEIRFLDQALDRLRMLSTAKSDREEESTVSHGDFGSANDGWEN